MDEEGGLRKEVVITITLKCAFFYRAKNIAEYIFGSEAEKITDLDWSCRIIIQTGHVELVLKRNASF